MIESVDFGWWAAEHDVRRGGDPDEVYVETRQRSAYDLPGKAIILGRKGAGKTALQLAFERTYRENWDFYLKIIGENIAFGQLVATYRSLSVQVHDQIGLGRALQCVWECGIFCGIANELLDSGAVLPATRTYLDRHDYRAADVHEILIDLVDYLCDSVRDLGDADSKGIRGATKLKGRISGFPQLKKEVLDTLYQSNGILVTFDRIDEYFEKRGKDRNVDDVERNAMRTFVEAFFFAIYSLSIHQDAIQFKILIPEDKYDVLSTRERDKLNQLVTRMRWRKDELREFVARRIARSLDLRHSDGSLDIRMASTWYSIFPRVIRNGGSGEPENVVDYLLRHTHYKPRDIQIFCAAVKDGAMSGDGIVTEEVIREAVASKTSELVENLKNEFSFEYPFLSDLFDEFRGASNLMDYTSDVGDVVGQSLKRWGVDFDTVLEIGYEVGLLGAVQHSKVHGAANVPHRRSHGRSYWFVFSHVVPNWDLRKSDQIVVHPMFNENLALTVNPQLVIGGASEGKAP